MAEIGKINNLEIVKEVDFGVYLDGEEDGEILLPKRYIPDGAVIGDVLEVFIYLDSEDRIIATTEKPLATAGEFAFLEVVAVTPFGAFLNWGLPKDLLVPFREQWQKMEVGRSFIVYIYLDHESKRIVASSKVEKFLDNLPVEFEVGEEVDLMVFGETELGYKAIVDDISTGILYKNEVFQTVKTGQLLKGYIKKIRDDEKIDLSLQKPTVRRFDEFTEKVLSFLKENNGSMPLTDKSPPEAIYEIFGMSKKNFKKAIGALYKKRMIIIDEGAIRLPVK
ncbi:S1 RNA binding domain [hydrothermal vent metagenome]|uniref:S1 RNA binding domain n=1 Tax=hydrothermal vent metagenome TaxID=652676 RepID=A0A3B0UCI6_9ZZZZ